MRYKRRRRVVTSNPLYLEHLRERNKRAIRHYASAPMRHPSARDRARLEIDRHVWKSGDRFYKLAFSYYGNSEFWWILAWYNLAPTEAYVGPGDVIHIPVNLESVLEIFGA